MARKSKVNLEVRALLESQYYADLGFNRNDYVLCGVICAPVFGR